MESYAKIGTSLGFSDRCYHHMKSYFIAQMLREILKKTQSDNDKT